MDNSVDDSLHFGFIRNIGSGQMQLEGFVRLVVYSRQPYGAYDRDLSRPIKIAAGTPRTKRISTVLEDV